MLEEHEVPLCPHCDQPILFADYAIATSHGAYYLAHEDCIELEKELIG